MPQNHKNPLDNHLTICYNVIVKEKNLIGGDWMSKTFPGTTIEVTRIEKGSSRTLFNGIFATGGITLSQVSVMTGLEPYVVQNWVKRGFLTSPKKRVYSRSQFARIIIINMLRESLQIDKICGLIEVIGGELDDETDDLISDDELYHRYVDMISDNELDILDAKTVERASKNAVADCAETIPGARKKLETILRIMIYAHTATEFRRNAEQILNTLG